MTPSSPLVRLATSADAAAITRIHNEGIEERIGTFETAPRTSQQVQASLVESGERFPTIVAEREGLVVAWAAAGPYRSRPCYEGVAEHSVYVDRSARRAGFGSAALSEFLRVYERLGFWKIVSRIFPENVGSLALHEKAGFRVVGIYKRHGRLDGKWRDCVIRKVARRGSRRLDGVGGAPLGGPARFALLAGFANRIITLRIGNSSIGFSTPRSSIPNS